MGTRATTIFQNQNNGIGLYTRWDGFPDEIKKSIINSEKIWDFSFKEIEDKVKNLPLNHPSQNLASWIQSYENFKKLPDSLEKQACLLAGQSFNHHYVVNDSSDGWDVVVQKEDKFTFKRKKALDFNNKNLSSTDIPDGYSLVKVSETLDEDKTEYSYFKIKNFSRDEFLNMMVSLPHFWTQFLMLDEFKELNHSKDSFIPSWRRSLKSFMSNRYDRESKATNSKESYFNDTIGNASSMIPFDFYYKKVYLHLFMQCPDKVLPLTFAEEKFMTTLSPEELDKKVVAEIELFPLLRLSVFGINFNKQEPISSVEFEKAMTHYKKQKEEIANYLGEEAIYSTPEYKDHFYEDTFSIPDLYLIKNKTMFIHYEISLLQNLYLLEKSFHKK